MNKVLIIFSIILAVFLVFMCEESLRKTAKIENLKQQNTILEESIKNNERVIEALKAQAVKQSQENEKLNQAMIESEKNLNDLNAAIDNIDFSVGLTKPENDKNFSEDKAAIDLEKKINDEIKKSLQDIHIITNDSISSNVDRVQSK